MNLTRVLNNALPEIPARTLAERYPRLDPGITFREHIEDGEPVFRIYVPCVEGMFKLPPQNWNLAKLFDGVRNYSEIAELYSRETGTQYDEEQIREFAADLERVQFWYRTPQEKNILLMQQTTEERRKTLQVRSRWADLSLVSFPAFNPDGFLTWFYERTTFVYTWWFTLLTLLSFGVTFGIFASHWGEVWRDTVEFYNFANKTWGDILLLYAVSLTVVALHELGHAYACKHYGARVRSMGFALVYLMPAFYTDTTEGVVMASRSQRFIIALAGIWAELILCTIATPIWWGTPPDTTVHNVAYYMMMQTGIMSLILNWNPLIKLDGYHMLCETLGISDLKENSTAYVSAWVRRRIWGLPVEIPYVPKRRRPGFAIYALLSGAYSYLVLFIVARFAGNVVRNFSPEWGFVPEIAVAALIFRSRIRLLVNFMKFLYLDKRDRILAWFTPRHTILAIAVAIVFSLLPIWRESVTGRYFLEPANSVSVRAHVQGAVSEIFVEEGQQVQAGTTLAILRNLPLESTAAGAKAEYLLAVGRARSAGVQYNGLGFALREMEARERQANQLALKNSNMALRSPISGTIMTPRPHDLIGSYLTDGQELVEVADLSVMRARIYVSEYQLNMIRSNAKAKIEVEGLSKKWNAETLSMAARPSEMDTRLMAESQLKGMNPPHYYLVDLRVKNDGGILKPGMSGTARIYGRRRSLAGLFLTSVNEFFGRKVW